MLRFDVTGLGSSQGDFANTTFSNVEGAIAELSRPLMIFHSPVDAIVSVDDARRIFQVARHPNSFGFVSAAR